MSREMFARLLRTFAVIVFLAFLVALAVAPAQATTVIVPSDDQLYTSSAAVVEGTVADINSRRLKRDKDVYTYIGIDVTRVFSGDLRPGRIVLKQIGGIAGKHFTQFHGTPEFSKGERVLLFLTADRDGALQTTFMFLGKYSIVEKYGQTMAVRDAARDGVLVLGTSHDGGVTTEAAPYDEFVRALRRRAVARPTTTDTSLVPEPREVGDPTAFLDETPHERFTLMSNKARWFEPDDLQPVPFKLRYTPFLLDGGEGAATDALAAWSNVPGSSLRLEYARDTELCGSVNDGENTISFDDCRDQIGGGGCFGIIAIGGARGVVNEQKTINGVAFKRITDADVVLNNGQNTCLTGHTLTLREIITHELGHCIGLGHSSQSGPEPNQRLAEATMYFQLHEDGRGASIKADDVDGLTFIYPESILPPGISTQSLNAARVGEPYEVEFQGMRGKAPYTWSFAAGNPPPGLTLSSEGVLSGTPTQMGEFSFTVTLADGDGKTDSREFSLDVERPRPIVSSASYQASKKRLTVICDPKAAGAFEVWVNGVRVSPPAKLKVKPADGSAPVRLIVKGTESALNLTQPQGSNIVVVTVDGLESLQFAF